MARPALPHATQAAAEHVQTLSMSIWAFNTLSVATVASSVCIAGMQSGIRES